MSKNYILNKDTGTLHFRGYCQYVPHTVENNDNYISFATENSARRENAISVKWCKVCARKIQNKLDK